MKPAAPSHPPAPVSFVTIPRRRAAPPPTPPAALAGRPRVATLPVAWPGATWPRRDLIFTPPGIACDRVAMAPRPARRPRGPRLLTALVVLYIVSFAGLGFMGGTIWREHSLAAADLARPDRAATPDGPVIVGLPPRTPEPAPLQPAPAPAAPVGPSLTVRASLRLVRATTPHPGGRGKTPRRRPGLLRHATHPAWPAKATFVATRLRGSERRRM